MKNRWLIAASAVGIHLSIGTIYAYSVLKFPLFNNYGWDVKLAFSVAIVFLGLSAAFMGHFVEKYGPRAAGTVAAIFFGTGILGAGLACWLAGNSLTKVLDQPTSSAEVKAALVMVNQKIEEELAKEGTSDTMKAALAEGKTYVNATLVTKQGTIKNLVDDEVARVKSANEAKSKVAGGDLDGRAVAIANAKVALLIKKVLITELLAPHSNIWKWLFLASYGVLGGIGLGVGYISPVSTLVKWFPDRRGLATGLAIMGFGFGSLVFAPVMQYLISNFSPATMFLVLGVVFLVLMLASALYLAPPPKDWKPKGFEAAVNAGTKKVKEDLSQLTANEAIKTPRFYFLWLMLFINVTCGIAVISAAAPMAEELVGMSATSAALMVGLMGLFNGLGRIGWASASDYLGRANTYIIFFALQAVVFFLLPLPFIVSSAILFQILIFLILSCYGGGFASIPAFIGDLFGTKQLGAIHGYILTAWAAAGIAGPITANFVRSTTGSYEGTLAIFAGLFLVALVIGVLMKVNIAQLRKAKASPQEQQSDDMSTPTMPTATGSA